MDLVNIFQAPYARLLVHHRAPIKLPKNLSFRPKRIKVSNEMDARDSSKESTPAYDQYSTSAADHERRKAGFHPSVWGDYFLSCSSPSKMGSENTSERRIYELKDKVVKFFSVAASKDDPVELLSLIDSIQRLGIGYQFKMEIDEALKRVHERCREYMDCSNVHLHTASLMFRLLRQQGYKVTCNVFDKFKDSEGNLDKSLATDAIGALSLYEACHLRVHEEDVLDEALSSTLNHLTSAKGDLSLSPTCRNEITRALRHPIRKGFRRVESRHYIEIYKERASHDEVLLEMAKLDFNRLQKMHQHELRELTKWWKALDVKENFPFARDRLVEMYFWSLLAYEPEHETIRIIFSKLCALYTILDDIYDAHGTIEELELFTRAIERWDMDVLDELPDYMQLFYKALLNLFIDIEQMLPEEVRSYRMFYGIQSVKNLSRAYLQEANWFNRQYVPSLEEYMKVGWVTGGLEVTTTAAILGMAGYIATKDVFEWLFGFPKLVRACTTASRLADDLVSHKFEQKRGHLASSVECYMKQYGVTEEAAEREIRKLIDDAWKDINEELLHLKLVPNPVLDVVIGLVRVLDCVYNEADLFTVTNTTMKDIVNFIIVDSIPV